MSGAIFCVSLRAMNTVRGCLFLLIVYTFGGNAEDPRGHLLPFGRHTVPHEVETITDFPVPREFFERFQLPGRPVVFKSILDRVKFPPYRLWSDDYLRTHYGDMIVDIEGGKKETRNGDMKFETMKKFLDEYKQNDIYMVQDLKKCMYGDMYIPRSMQCGGYQNYIETVVIWFSSGGTKSVIHFDTQENFNCLLDGTKDIVLVDRKYKEQIEADGFVEDGSYSSIDVDSVDMYKYPRIQELPTFKSTLKAGDCLYIPYRWYHQVNSFGSRNLAVNIWFSHTAWFNYSNCENVATEEQTVPFSDYDFIKPGVIETIHLFDDLAETTNITREAFLESFVKPEADDKDAILAYVDKNGDSNITWDELFQVDARDIIRRFKPSLKLSPTFFKEVEELRFAFDHGEVPEAEPEPEILSHDEF